MVTRKCQTPLVTKIDIVIMLQICAPIRRSPVSFYYTFNSGMQTPEKHFLPYIRQIHLQPFQLLYQVLQNTITFQ